MTVTAGVFVIILTIAMSLASYSMGYAAAKKKLLAGFALVLALNPEAARIIANGPSSMSEMIAGLPKKGENQ